MPYNQQGETSCNCGIAFELVSAAKNNGIKQVWSRNCVAIALRKIFLFGLTSTAISILTPPCFSFSHLLFHSTLFFTFLDEIKLGISFRRGSGLGLVCAVLLKLQTFVIHLYLCAKFLTFPDPVIIGFEKILQIFICRFCFCTFSRCPAQFSTKAVKLFQIIFEFFFQLRQPVIFVSIPTADTAVFYKLPMEASPTFSAALHLCFRF